MLDPEERDAVILNVAIKEKPILDYTSIIELSCIYSPQELLAVKRAYQTRYKHSVEEDLALHSTGELRKACDVYQLLLHILLFLYCLVIIINVGNTHAAFGFPSGNIQVCW